MSGKYINDKGHEVPDNTILVVPHSIDSDGNYKDIILDLKGNPKRDWFNSHFYYCLPLSIGNQYGYVIKSLRDFTASWDGTDSDAKIEFLNNDNENLQVIKGGFGQGIITIQNLFAFKTPPGINLMTIQPPNWFIPGTSAMTGVVETDQIRRDFTFNLKITVPNMQITVKKGDALGAFIPIPRHFVDKFDVKLVTDVFDKEFHVAEVSESQALSQERQTTDVERPHMSGRRYFNGVHVDGTKYPDHQKRVPK
jgi:hypothetical protein